MGCTPSKAKQFTGGTASVSPFNNSEGSTSVPTAELTESDDELTAYCDRATASMIAFRGSRNFDEEALRHLNDISEIYYEKCNRDKRAADKICSILLGHDVLKVFARLWDKCHERPDEFYSNVSSTLFKNLDVFKVILWNFSDKCPRLALECYRIDAVTTRIMREFSLPQLAPPQLHQKMLRHMVKANLGIFHNILRHCNNNKYHIRKNNGIEHIRDYEKSEYSFIKAKVFIVLAYCINEDENSKIIADSGVITFIIEILGAAVTSQHHVAEAYEFSAEETVAALNKLALNDENKKSIVDANVLPLLTTLLEDESSSASEQLECVNCLWSLAFHKDSKQRIIEEPGLMTRIEVLRNDDKLTKAIEGLVIVLGLEKAAPNQVQEKQKHIMISYNWEVKPIMLKVRDFLSSHDVNIWMDVDNMHGSILSAMGDAVENSTLVLIAMTESYKNSLACRTEAEYAFNRKIPVLPLLLQSGYKADGWLGALAGMKLYVDLSSPGYEQKLPDVLKEIRSLVNVPLKRVTLNVAANSSRPHVRRSNQGNSVERPVQAIAVDSPYTTRITEILERILEMKEEENALQIRYLKLQIEKLQRS